MKLLFLRHGIAEERGPDQPDRLRQLTDEGRSKMRKAASGMIDLKIEFDRILSSPYARAWQTAEIVAHAFDVMELLQEDARLSSGCSFGDLREALRPLPANARVLLVGHEPDFSSAIETFIGGGGVRMRKGSLACVECDAPEPGHGLLRWLLDPDLMERAAR